MVDTRRQGENYHSLGDVVQTISFEVEATHLGLSTVVVNNAVDLVVEERLSIELSSILAQMQEVVVR